MLLLPADTWSDYELIDSGNFEKLERFGRYILIRPEPQAIWSKKLYAADWETQSHARFRIEKNDPEKGKWLLKPGMPEQWWIEYKHGKLRFKLRLGLTAFRHIGVFPEQSSNWNFIFDQFPFSGISRPKVLNLFAYTGGASLSACAAGADVYHVDSVKPVLSWARDNMEQSGLDGIHWIAEDALKFARREVRRGNRYHGIILDPPAYGRGPDGEKWILEDSLNELMMLCGNLLAPGKSFVILNMYSMGYSSLVAKNLIDEYFQGAQPEFGELFIPASSGVNLPLGTFVRFSV